MNKSAVVVVAVIALVAGALMSWYMHHREPVKLEDGIWFGEQARSLPEFQLSDHRAAKLDRARLSGHWNLMFFGYTHCPDICPIALQTLKQMYEAIDDADVREALRIYFVSVDPDRDTPAHLADYVGYFHPEFVGATAPIDSLRQLTGALGIAHQLRKQSESDTSYLVDHSGAIVLINPQAEYAGLFSAPHDHEVMARDITRIIEYN